MHTHGKMKVVLCLVALTGCGGGNTPAGNSLTRSYQITDFGSPQGMERRFGLPGGLNTAGDVVGPATGVNSGSASSGPPQPVLHRAGQWVGLGPQGALGTVTTINSAGQSVGTLQQSGVQVMRFSGRPAAIPIWERWEEPTARLPASITPVRSSGMQNSPPETYMRLLRPEAR